MSYSEPNALIYVYSTLIPFSLICFVLILSYFLYLICLRRHRPTTNVDWPAFELTFPPSDNNLSTAELGLSRDVIEMPPIVIFNQSLSLNNLQCSVCLEDYEADEKLRKIGGCGHTFHMECLDKWLPSNPTCPICRFSLQTIEIVSSNRNSSGGASARPESQPTSEAVSHIDDGQEYIQEVSNETEENGRNNIGTSG